MHKNIEFLNFLPVFIAYNQGISDQINI